MDIEDNKVEAASSSAAGKSNVVRVTNNLCYNEYVSVINVSCPPPPRPPAVQGADLRRRGQRPSEEVVAKTERWWKSRRVVQREDILPICQALANWQKLASELGLEERRVRNWERQAMEEKQGQWLAAKRMLLAWLQKDDLNATMGKLVWKLRDLKEWTAIMCLPDCHPTDKRKL